MELDARMIITIAGMAASVITSFIVVRQKVSELDQNLKDAARKLAKLDARLDRNDNATDLVGQRINLQRDVDSLKKMHNGKHPKLDL